MQTYQRKLIDPSAPPFLLFFLDTRASGKRHSKKKTDVKEPTPSTFAHLNECTCGISFAQQARQLRSVGRYCDKRKIESAHAMDNRNFHRISYKEEI